MTIMIALLGFVLLIAVVSAPIWMFLGQQITALEIRILLSFIFVFIIILLFAVLRLYNALVANTKVLLSTSRKLDKHISELRRITGDSTSVAKAFTSAAKAIGQYTEKILSQLNKKTPDAEI